MATAKGKDGRLYVRPKMQRGVDVVISAWTPMNVWAKKTARRMAASEVACFCNASGDKARDFGYRDEGA